MKKLLAITLFFAILLLPCADAQLPFIVRVIYFQPTDAPAMPANIPHLMIDVQSFYRDEMERHGYDAKTFRLEKNDAGHIVVHTVKGKKKPNFYTSYQALEPELPRELRNTNNIHVFFMGGMRFVKPGTWGVGYPFAGASCGGIVRIATIGEAFRLSVVAHELGHAFGLYHNIKKGDFLMGPGRKELDDYEARWLNAHHYFNSIHEINAVPKVVKTHQTEHVGIKVKGVEFQERDGVRFKIDVESRNTLYQAQILRASDVGIVGWDELKGNHDTIEIDVLRSDLLKDRIAYLEFMDSKGNYNIHTMPFTLPKVPTRQEKEQKADEKEASVSAHNKLTLLWARLKKPL